MLAEIIGTNTRLSKDWAASGEFLHYWLPNLRSAFAGSWAEVDYPTGGLKRDYRSAVGLANLVWSPVKNLDLGFEVAHAGAAEERRHFVDWALFHVEHEYVETARRFRRALKQRNALLRSGTAGTALDAWDAELVRSGESWDRWRAAYLARLMPVVGRLADLLLPELGAPALSYQRGWTAELSLERALLERRDLPFQGANRFEVFI